MFIITDTQKIWPRSQIFTNTFWLNRQHCLCFRKHRTFACAHAVHWVRRSTREWSAAVFCSFLKGYICHIKTLKSHFRLWWMAFKKTRVWLWHIPHICIFLQYPSLFLIFIYITLWFCVCVCARKQWAQLQLQLIACFCLLSNCNYIECVNRLS